MTIVNDEPEFDINAYGVYRPAQFVGDLRQPVYLPIEGSLITKKFIDALNVLKTIGLLRDDSKIALHNQRLVEVISKSINLPTLTLSSIFKDEIRVHTSHLDDSSSFKSLKDYYTRLFQLFDSNLVDDWSSLNYIDFLCASPLRYSSEIKWTKELIQNVDTALKNGTEPEAIAVLIQYGIPSEDFCDFSGVPFTWVVKTIGVTELNNVEPEYRKIGFNPKISIKMSLKA